MLQIFTSNLNKLQFISFCFISFWGSCESFICILLLYDGIHLGSARISWNDCFWFLIEQNHKTNYNSCMVMNSSWFYILIQAICYVNFQINRDYMRDVSLLLQKISITLFWNGRKLCVLVFILINFSFLYFLKAQVIILFEYKFQL